MTLKVSNDAFVAAWREAGGSPVQVSKILGLDLTATYRRRASLAKQGIMLPTTHPIKENGSQKYGWQATPYAYRERVDETLVDGTAVIFGDAHWWGPPSLAHRAMCRLIKSLKPKLIIGNGDLVDGANISRHDPMGWQKLPTVREEIETVKERLREIDLAAPKATKRKTVGNHDSRMDRRLATEVSEFEGMPGFRLQDHILWPMSYVVVINKDAPVPVLVMHNFRGGTHAPFNNAVNSGATIVTGHLHSQQRAAFTDYFHTKYGVDHGMLADPAGPQFSYAMGRPRSWRSGCCVMTFDKEGRHLPPELLEVQIYPGFKRAVFRGKVVMEEALSPEETADGIQERYATTLGELGD